MASRKPKKPTPTPLDVELALVSIRKGRGPLARKLATYGEAEVPVLLVGRLVHVWGKDDGIDQEFQMTVDHAVRLDGAA